MSLPMSCADSSTALSWCCTAPALPPYNNASWRSSLPVYIAGDFNIRLDRPDDVHAVQLRLLVDCYGLLLHDSDTTHQLGGTVDAVITRDDVGRPQSVTVTDAGCQS